MSTVRLFRWKNGFQGENNPQASFRAFFSGLVVVPNELLSFNQFALSQNVSTGLEPNKNRFILKISLK